MRTGAATAAAVLALAVAPALGGCAGEATPAATTVAGAPTGSMTYFSSTAPAPSTPATPAPATSAASPTSVAATADIAAPALPAAAKANTPDGAAAFARHYFDVLNYAWQKPDAASLTGLADAECVACSKQRATATSLAAAGQRVDAPPVHVETSEPGAEVYGEQIVTVTGTEGRYSQVGGATASPLSSKAGRLNLQVFLKYANGSWRITEVEKTTP